VLPHGAVDAHAHVWDLVARDQPWIPAGSPIRRTFTLTDLRAAIAETPVDRVVLVQVVNDADETADFLNMAAAEDCIVGVVGWADLGAPAIGEALAMMLCAPGPLVGVRHQALAETDPTGWLRSAAVQRGLAELDRLGVPFDLIVRPEHCGVAAAVARAHPSLQFVLNHLGKPPIASGELERWATEVRLLAAEPNVACKLSGLPTLAPRSWGIGDVAPFLDVALEAFGPSRLLFGSDWPVCTSAASYAETYELAAFACRGLSAPEATAVLGGNARRIYGLQ
jgi:L-fuconolactonase